MIAEDGTEEWRLELVATQHDGVKLFIHVLVSVKKQSAWRKSTDLS